MKSFISSREAYSHMGLCTNKRLRKYAMLNNKTGKLIALLNGHEVINGTKVSTLCKYYNNNGLTIPFIIRQEGVFFIDIG